MWKAAILLAIAVVTASGCTSTRAQVPLERPTLDVPPVPPRIIEPAPAPDFAGTEPVPPLPPETTEAADPAPSRSKPAARDATAKETQKPDPKPPDAPVAEQAVLQPPPPVPVLRTPATADTAAAARQITETIERAQKILEDVDYGRLSAPRQKAYNEVKDFITSAERELKASSFELAKDFAEKAEKYATALQQGR